MLSSLSTVPSASVSGTDMKGDKWTLTLYGPGTMNVVDPDGNAFTKDTQDIPDDINTITVSGTVTSQEPAGGQGDLGPRELGRARLLPAAHDQPTREPTGNSTQTWSGPGSRTPQNGIAAVDMPELLAGPHRHGRTDAEFQFPFGRRTFGSTPFKLAGGINAPEGINNLRFGGVDTTFTPAGGTALNDDQAEQRVRDQPRSPRSRAARASSSTR